jgi:DNA-binding MarR family transcriptional regulator
MDWIDMDVENLVDEAMELVPQLMRQYHAELVAYSESVGFTAGQMKALAYMYHRGRCTVGEIAEGLFLAMPTVSELIDKLVERGLVERGVNPADRRQVHVWLNEEGIAIGREMRDWRRAHYRMAFEELSEAEGSALVHGLRALLAAMAKVSGVSAACLQVGREASGRAA